MQEFILLPESPELSGQNAKTYRFFCLFGWWREISDSLPIIREPSQY